MIPLFSVGLLYFLSCLAAIITSWLLLELYKHLLALFKRLQKPPLDAPVVNLQGFRFARASREYYNNLWAIVTDGYHKVSLSFDPEKIALPKSAQD